jgi:hypothetical protein
MEVLRKIWAYLSFKKQPSPAGERGFNLRAMHFINKLSILMFVVGLCILVYKLLS